MSGRSWRALYFALPLAVLVISPVPFSRAAAAPEQPEQIAAVEARFGLRPQVHDRVTLPRPLSRADAERYRRIFALQEAGDLRGADVAIAEVQDPLLMGHVLAQRYLHPSAYRSEYRELGEWLARYSDHAEAPRIYALAMKRKPKGAPAPKQPDGAYLAGTPYDFGSEPERSYRPAKTLSAAEAEQAEKLLARIRAKVRAGNFSAARELVEGEEARRLLDAVERDMARAEIATAYYTRGRNEEAFDLAAQAARDSGAAVPEAHWTAGLAAWRLGRTETAAAHFEAATRSPFASQWDIAAAAYWAARAHLVAREPAEVSRWLKTAATYNRSFYGLLARRALGLEPELDWSAPALDEPSLERAMARPGVVRALALIQTGERARAEAELRKIYLGADAELAETVLALALEGSLPGLAMRIGVDLARSGRGIKAAALYPVPAWEPEGGFTLDRALMFAVIRQESRFDTEARSSMGARGLMQIMPATAKFMAASSDTIEGTVEELYDPETNITLGQKYLAHLLDDAAVQNNLFWLAAAYNAGPGKLAEWRRRLSDIDDPLLFIESLPARETRAFVERVLANLWIYQLRLGQPTPTLDAVAGGDWPVYAALDEPDVEVAANDED